MHCFKLGLCVGSDNLIMAIICLRVTEPSAGKTVSSTIVTPNLTQNILGPALREINIFSLKLQIYRYEAVGTEVPKHTHMHCYFSGGF